MKRYAQKIKAVCLVILSIIFLFSIAGCNESELRRFGFELTEIKVKTAAVIDAADRRDQSSSDTLDILKILQTTNAASSPINPFALPVGIGLTGIITLLEALRRKEKDGRKYAEHELKNGNGKNGNKRKS